MLSRVPGDTDTRKLTGPTTISSQTRKGAAFSRSLPGKFIRDEMQPSATQTRVFHSARYPDQYRLPHCPNFLSDIGALA
jgi:hypothetical protein